MGDANNERATCGDCNMPIWSASADRWHHVDAQPRGSRHRARPKWMTAAPTVRYVCMTCAAPIERFAADVSGGVDWRHVEGEDEIAHLAWPNGKTVTVADGTPVATSILKDFGVKVADFVTKTTDVNDAFATGSVRGDRTGKGRYDLLPREAVHRVAQIYERGGRAYGDKNWELGQPFSRVLDSLLRHAFQAAAGMDDEDHLAAVCFNAMAVMTFQERIAAGELPADLDDLGRS